MRARFVHFLYDVLLFLCVCEIAECAEISGCEFAALKHMRKNRSSLKNMDRFRRNIAKMSGNMLRFRRNIPRIPRNMEKTGCQDRLSLR